MIPDWGALGAAGSFGQFLVVLVAAILALRQLEHLRRHSELEGSIPYLHEYRTANYLEGISLLRAAANGDVELTALIERNDIADPRAVKIWYVANFFNEMGLLVEKRLIRGDTILPNYRSNIIMAWDVLIPMVRQHRTGPGWSAWAPFEALAVRARAMNVDHRFAEVRASLPRSLRADFDRSMAQTRPLAEKGAFLEEDAT